MNIELVACAAFKIGTISDHQQAYGYKDFALDYGNPDFVKYAESYGGKGFNINSADELLPALENAFQEKGPVIVECPIDYSENKKIFSGELDDLSCPM